MLISPSSISRQLHTATGALPPPLQCHTRPQSGLTASRGGTALCRPLLLDSHTTPRTVHSKASSRLKPLTTFRRPTPCCQATSIPAADGSIAPAQQPQRHWAATAVLLSVSIWGVCWALTMGLIHSGYSVLVGLTHLGVSIAPALGVTGGSTDYTDLALRVAQHLVSTQHQAALASALDSIPHLTKTALGGSLLLWRFLQLALETMGPVVPYLLFVAQIGVTVCLVVFTATLTPLRPLLLLMTRRRQGGTTSATQKHAFSFFPQRPDQPAASQDASSQAAGSSDSAASDPSQGSTDKVPPRPVPTATESTMKQLGTLSLVVLLTAAQATACPAPPLNSGITAQGVTGGPSVGANLFALIAPLTDLLLPLLLAAATAMLLLQGPDNSGPTAASESQPAASADGQEQQAADGGQGSVATATPEAPAPSESATTLATASQPGETTDTTEQQGATTAALAASQMDGAAGVASGGVRRSGWWRQMLRLCLLRAAVDVVLLVAQLAGYLASSVVVVRVLLTALLLRLLWQERASLQ